jgi:putative methionine-R-sulfoxide reductase with GAF domain
VDWHSLVVAPALYKGCVKGVLYVSASVKHKEFSDDESSYIQKAAGIIATIC